LALEAAEKNRAMERFTCLGKTYGWDIGMLGVQRLDGWETKLTGQ